MPSITENKTARTEAQWAAYSQHKAHIAEAHMQALKLMLEGLHPYPLTVRGCRAYYNLARSKLSESEFQNLLSLIDSCTKPDFDVVATLVRICDLLQHHSDLIRGFGMFLPPDFNLRLQSGEIPLLATVKEESDSSSEMSETENEAEDSSQKEMEVDTSTDMEVSVDATEKSPTSVDKEGPNAPKTLDKDYAVSFLNKVNERFNAEPEVFERFLELLNSIKKNCLRTNDNIETEVFYEVSELFCGHNDLIEEFKVFVPHANYGPSEQDQDEMSDNPEEDTTLEELPSEASGVSKFSFVVDSSMAPVYKYGSYEEHMFFDKVREAVGHREVYDNFLRCLLLFNEDVITKSELIKLATSFLGKFPDLLVEFKSMLGYKESGNNIERVPMKIISLDNERKRPEIGLDIDYSSGGRNGASYRALSKDFQQPKCSGRTPLCDEVLNDTWVSFPSWSEDSTFVTSCKTQYEEIIYRCEDERFELDMAITANACTMQVLGDIQKRMNKMGFEERQMLHLDDSLGTGGSTVLHQRALHRMYGDKTYELVEGLKRNPWVAVPIILKRLKAKDDEWREKQRRYNEIWRTQIDQYYLKSLDHMGINFKQNDSKTFRPKSLLNDMEMVFAEKRENQGFKSPHFVLEFSKMEVFQDAINLMLQYLKKLPGVYREDRRKIELLIRSFIPDFFAAPRCTLTGEDLEAEDESREPEEAMEIRHEEEERSGQTTPTGSNRDDGSSDLDEFISNETDNSDDTDKSFIEEICVFDRIDPLPPTNLPYTIFFASKTWYVFFRQFHILCERLARLLVESSKQSDIVAREAYLEDDEVQELRSKPSYRELIEQLSLLLSGAIDYSQFEEESRSLFGIHAFISFTMDKLVLSIVRQLQQVVTDDVCKQCTSLFIQSVKSIASAGLTSPMEASRMEHSYLRKVEKAMEDERCFKAVWHKKKTTLTIELLDQENEEDAPDPIETEKWSNYLDDFLNEEFYSEDVLTDSEQLPVILPRNLKKMKAHWERKVAELEKSWQLRQSAKFVKRSIVTNKKRKALALLSHSLAKMARRSTAGGNVHASIVEAPSVDNSIDEHPFKMSVHASIIEAPSEERETEEEKEAVVPEESMSEPLEDKDDVDAHNPEFRVIITTEEDAEKPELVLVELSGEDEMGVQEESVQNSDLQIEIEFGDLNPEPLADIEEQISVPEESGTIQVEVEEAMDLDEAGKEEPQEKSVAAEEETKDAEVGEGSGEKNLLADEQHVQDIGAEMDLFSKVEEGVETASPAVESTAEEVSKIEETLMSDCIEEKVEEDPSSKREPMRRRIVSKPYDYSIRTRRNRSNQTYVKRRLKKGIARTLQAGKGKRKKAAKTKSEILDDPSFDYNYFSELSEGDKVLHLLHTNLCLLDNVEVSFKPESIGIQFVQDCNMYLYRKKSLFRAKEAHQSISEIKTSNFNAWHQVWLDRYVTQSMLKCCNDWLLKSDAEVYRLVRLNAGDCRRPPYIPYYRYKMRYYKTDPQ